MTEIIITIKPEHLSNIRSGKKTFEIRKTAPNCSLPFKVYCCVSGSHGNITAEFVCDHVPCGYLLSDKGIKECCCVSIDELNKYCERTFEKPYYWHITKMIDYTCTPGYTVRNISEFGLKRPPQSWCYVKERTSLNINTCICCGAIIPEGLQVCPICLEKEGLSWHESHKNTDTI